MEGITPPRHTREIPPEWPELIERARALVPTDLGRTDPLAESSSAELFHAALAVPDAEREASYYYGLGEIMTRMAGPLQHEEVRGVITDHVAMSMLRGAMQRRGAEIPADEPFRPLIGDLDSDVMGEPFEPLAQAAAGSLPPYQRYLTDALSYATLQRRTEEAIKSGLPVPPLPEDIAIAGISSSDSAAAHNIAENSLAGASRVYMLLLTGVETDQELTPELLAQPIDPEAIAEASQSRAFTGLANFRADEFHSERLGPYTGRTPEFDAGRLSMPPPPPDPPDISKIILTAQGELHLPSAAVLHIERLKCPALKAGGLLGDVSHHILPEAVKKAAELVPEEWLRIVPPGEA